MPTHQGDTSSDTALGALTAALRGDRALNWVMTGDSITQGLVHTDGGRSYPEHLHEILRGDRGRRRDVVVNSAISGNRLSDVLADGDRRISSWRPDVVMLMIGTNDAAVERGRPDVSAEEFTRSLRDFVHRARTLGAVTVFQTPPPVDHRLAPERLRVNDFVAAMRHVAASERVVLVDHHARFIELGGGAFPAGLMADAFHPNAAGHAALALTLARALGIAPHDGRTVPLLEAQVSAALS